MPLRQSTRRFILCASGLILSLSLQTATAQPAAPEAATGTAALNAVSADPATTATTAATILTTASNDASPAQQAASTPPSAIQDTAPTTQSTEFVPIVDSSRINAGDTAWMLTSTALVLLMTIPGLALFYGGMVRKKNVLSTMAYSFAAACIVTILWVVIGYSLAFTPGNAFIGGFSKAFLKGMTYLKGEGRVSIHELAPTIPESVFMMFQMTFAIITPALITGAFVERIKFSAVFLFTVLWSLCVYVPVAHWVWSPQGWLAAKGALDFAGGTVVHINAGISGLVAAVIIGPRTGFGKESMAPHNLALTLIGASLLWVGWFGFNAGSAGAADGRAGMAMVVTQVATAAGALSWSAVEWFRRGQPSVLGLVSGAVAGLVAITPASGFVGIGGALAIGVAGGVACYWAATSLKSALGYDDSLDVFGVHAVAGILGALLTGVFAIKEIGGVEGSVMAQAVAVVSTVVYAGLMTTLILLVIHLVVGLRATPEAEQLGLDRHQHGEHVA
jgi:ammonium transporter, Amt family